jgi:putative colanic acid biosynthesis UDP-glucose lipid carrier transferase
VGGPNDTIDVGQLESLPPSDNRLVHTKELGRFRGDFDRLVADARAGKIDIVYVALPLRAEPRIRHLVAALADTTATVHVVADVLLTELMQSRFSMVGEVPVIDVFDHPFHGVDGTLKRIEDFVLGTIILSIIAIPMAVIAVAIKLTSKGPVLFRQRRYGLNGQEIHVLKFRTMTVAEDGTKVTQATKNDARITKLGAFLRRTSLDELPQFFHVITGEMSIVGPRPHAVAHNEQYRRLIPGYMLRHKVKPGITGWAQVNGWRGETDTLEKMEKRVQHDLAYIRNWALFFDLRIIFLTIFGRSVRKNAY